ncbi:hypothetical protein C8Q70DRAFT_961143 [Cubamyces menziesii]|nr:hypothetical protein C8Q70DRAFT_961143 [Cubamyces menziesii]
MSLKVSAYTKKPVRVIRGYKSSSDFAPAQGYRYDGLYVVEKVRTQYLIMDLMRSSSDFDL